MAAPVQYMAPAVQKTACQLSRVCSFPRMLVITCRHYIAIKSFFSTDTPIILDDLNQVILSITRRKKTVEKMMTLLRKWWHFWDNDEQQNQGCNCSHATTRDRVWDSEERPRKVWCQVDMAGWYLVKTFVWTIFVENICLNNICWKHMAQQYLRT